MIFVVLVHGTREDAEALRGEVADVLAPMGLRLSPAKTKVMHMSDGFDFLGFRIQWKRKRGTGKWYVYTFIADQPVRSLKDKIRALRSRTSQQPGSSQVDEHPVLVGLAVILRTGQDQAAPLVERTGHRLKRLAFPGEILRALSIVSRLRSGRP